jgi:MSHA pilin protein MshC
LTASRDACTGRLRAGLTLVELVVVLVVVALLAAVAGPRFMGSRPFDERLFLEEALAALRYGQKVALATGCPVEVTAAAGSYALAQRSGCETGAFDLPLAHPLGLAGSYTGSAPPGVVFALDAGTFHFDAQGRVRLSDGTVSDLAVTVGAHSVAIAGETGLIDAP